MATQTQSSQLASSVYSLLGGLRTRIRAYVLIEGLMLAIVWLAATFWAAIGFDYVFVLLGVSELPWPMRAVMLAGIAGVLVYIVYRWILRRSFVGLANRSMAVLLERRFHGFRDSLVTSVEMNENPQHALDFNKSMLQQAARDAEGKASLVRLRQIFNMFPLFAFSFLAVFLVGAIAAFAAYAPEPAGIGARRIYLLSDEPWPRYAHIEIVGIEVESKSTKLSESGETLNSIDTIKFVDGKAKVAEGDKVRLLVRADASARIVPRTCTVYYTTSDGGSNYAMMQSSGAITDGYRNFAYSGKPFNGVDSNITFDVLGFDHRVRDYEIQMVRSPALTDIKVHTSFPSYLVNKELSLFLDRTVPLTPNMRLPMGSTVTIHATSNKPLKSAQIHNMVTGATEEITFNKDSKSRTAFSYTAAALTEDLELQITLQDVDNVRTQTPQRVFIGAIEDNAPTVEARLRGISNAITPTARIPAVGVIRDDYEVKEAWMQIEATGNDPTSYPVNLTKAGDLDDAIDFRKIANDAAAAKKLKEEADALEGDKPAAPAPDGEAPAGEAPAGEAAPADAEPKALLLKPGDKLKLTIQASDRYNLGGAANIGSGDVYEIEVVTPDELIRRLEVREIGLRRRVEHIIEEMAHTRVSLETVKEAGDATIKAPTGAEPGEEEKSMAKLLEEIKGTRSLRTQQAGTQSDKSAGEVVGVAENFQDMHDEIDNNRLLQISEKQDQMQNEVIAPLQEVGTKMFGELRERLKVMEETLEDRKKGPAAADLAIEQTAAIIKKLETVLEKLVDIEDFNELLEMVRRMIKEQEQLIDATERAKEADLIGGGL